MVGLPGNAHAIRALRVTRPDFITTRTRQMERHAPSIRAETQSVGHALTRASEFPRSRAIKVHAENLPGLVPHHLHQDALIADEQRRCVEDSETFAGGDFGERILVEIVEPKMGWRLGVILFKGLARTIASRLHAEKNHAATIGKKWTRLPGPLVGHIELEVTQPCAI